MFWPVEAWMHRYYNAWKCKELNVCGIIYYIEVKPEEKNAVCLRLKILSSFVKHMGVFGRKKLRFELVKMLYNITFLSFFNLFHQA